MRKLFDDGSECCAVISRPNNRKLKFRESEKQLARQIASAKPPMLCFDRECKTEIRSFGACIFVSPSGNDSFMAMAICPKCAKQSDEKILATLREEMIERSFDKPPPSIADKATPIELFGACMEASGIPIIFDGVEKLETWESKAAKFANLLALKKLPRLEAFHRAYGNCHDIAEQIFLDLKALGFENDFDFKIGFSHMPTKDGAPIGLHSWIERDGWVIDCSGGAVGNPILFQRTQKYYEERKLTDVKPIRFS